MSKSSSIFVTGKLSFSYAKKDLLHAAIMLHAALEAPDRLLLVLELQRHLLRCVIRTERRVQRIRRRIIRLKQQVKKKISREIANTRKEYLESLRKREEELIHLLFLYRCFGDGIAFIYQSRHSLKHTYYDGNYNVKESAGFMTEHGRLKRGFSREYRVLCSGIKNNVPVVLSDLTNIVRYGDVCALGADDPLPLEVKTSQNRNSRTSRQDELRKSLIDFYKNDGADLFRGISNVKRVTLFNEESDYRDSINSCVSVALKSGWCSLSPEPGLTYIAWSGENHSQLGNLELTDSTCIFSISPHPSHLPSYPFTLSLIPENCISFILQQVQLIVAIELKAVKAAFRRHDVHAIMLMNGEHAIQLTRTPDDLIKGTWRVSELIFARIATEFLSIEVFAEQISRIFDIESERVISFDDARKLSAIVTDVPVHWRNAVDCWNIK